MKDFAQCDCGTRENARMITANLQSLMCWCAETMTLVNQQRSLVDTCLVYADPCVQPPPCATVRQEKATGVQQPCYAFEETQTTQSRKVDDEAPQPRQATERDIEGLRELFQRERQKADAELAETRREIATQVEQSRKADDEAARLKQATERDIEELRQLLQQERQRIDAELAEARREIETRDAQLRPVTERDVEELRKSLQQEREKTTALEKEAKAAQVRATALESDLETQATKSRETADEAVQFRQAKEQEIAELQQSLQQEREKTTALEKEAKAAQVRATALESDLETQATKLARRPMRPCSSGRRRNKRSRSCNSRCSRSAKKPPSSRRRPAGRARRK